MKDIFLSVIEDILLYNNNRFLIPVFLVAFVCLWILEKDKSVRKVLVYAVTALILVFLCPLYAKIAFRIDSEIYYRVWWTIPFGIIICYCFVKIMFITKKIWSRALILLLALLAIVVNGKLVYTNSIHFKASNVYHIPEIVVQVGEAVTFECENPTAIFPLELVPFIRQYDGKIMTPFTRYYFGDLGELNDPLYKALKSDIYDIETIVNSANEHGTLYVVLSSLKEKDARMQDYGYELINNVYGYEIYRNQAVYHDLVECGIIAK